MDHYQLIEKKLHAFVRKYEMNKLLKGVLLFAGIGLLYLLLTLGLEYFLWFGRTTRAILFWLFIVVEGFLVVFFIGIPIARLFKLRKGINKQEASELIGIYFPEVGDKLKNLLQLRASKSTSDLLLAGINQKSMELKPVPFSSAVRFKVNLKYLKLVLFPVLIIAAILIAGNLNFFTSSFSRLSHYNQEYIPPAPFRFIVENDELRVNENSTFKLRVSIMGQVKPETVKIVYNNQEYFLKNEADGTYQYEFKKLTKPVDFRLSANEVNSESFQIEVIKVPKLLNFKMNLNYPAYTGLKQKILTGTGNVRVPEGTIISWNFETEDAQQVNLNTLDSLYLLNSNKDSVSFSKRIRRDFPYEISVSNANIKKFETLKYNLKVTRDEYPKIEFEKKQDSLESSTFYYKGQLTDDYGLRQLELVYYPENLIDSAQTINIPIAKGTFSQFHYVFPGNLKLSPGTDYQYFFRLRDNDAVNGPKSTKSEVFSFHKESSKELEDFRLNKQRETIQNMDNSLENLKNSKSEFDRILKGQKEQQNSDYNDKKRLEQFIERQEKQNELMKSYSKKLNKSLKGKDKKEAFLEKELEKRMEENEERLKQNEDLLKELKEYSDKLQQEELGKKLEELGKQNKSQERSLEQLLELTKRYYVEEKKQKLARDLLDMGERQEKNIKSPTNSSKSQKELKKEFQEFQKDMDKLEEENEKLKKPQDLSRDKIDEETIENEQKKAEEQLDSKKPVKAQEHQKKAGDLMEKMARKMQQSSMKMNAKQMQEDSDMLRQILENVLAFSFMQEDLLNDFNSMDQSNPRFASKLKKQSNLREHFKHIDDSLYSLALRNPAISNAITDNLVDIDFNLNKSLDRLSQNQMSRASSSQRYVVTGANDLAYMLSKSLSSMQDMMQSGAGGGEQIQLPDIIKKQEELIKEMQQGEKENNNAKEKNSGKNGEQQQKEIYEMYKQQEMLRMQLEKLLEEQGNKQGNDVNRKMKKIGEDLLDKGLDPLVLEKMKNLNYELLKLKKAAEVQGENNERESKSNQKLYINRLKDQLNRAKEYFNSTEILNRQSLPLRPIFKEKIKKYFGAGQH